MGVKPLIYDYSYQELSNLMQTWREPGYHASQIWHGLYQQLWKSSSEFTDLPKSLRKQLSEQFSFSYLDPLRTVSSEDGDTEKTLFQLSDNEQAEAVLMHYQPSQGNRSERNTLCISTQVGCAMGCVFCATGQMGFKRNLRSGEIVEQVLFYSRDPVGA